MAVKLGILALLEAKPGKSDEVAVFLESGRALAVAEEGTVTWYAFKVDATTYRVGRRRQTSRCVARTADVSGMCPPV